MVSETLGIHLGANPGRMALHTYVPMWNKCKEMEPAINRKSLGLRPHQHIKIDFVVSFPAAII